MLDSEFLAVLGLCSKGTLLEIIKLTCEEASLDANFMRTIIATAKIGALQQIQTRQVKDSSSFAVAMKCRAVGRVQKEARSSKFAVAAGKGWQRGNLVDLGDDVCGMVAGFLKVRRYTPQTSWKAHTKDIVGEGEMINDCDFRYFTTTPFPKDSLVLSSIGQARHLPSLPPLLFFSIISKDGRTLVTCANHRNLKVWDASNGDLKHTLQGHQDCVECVEFSPDGRFILSASVDQTLKIWDSVSAKLIRSLQGHEDELSSCSWSPCSKLVLSASDDQTLKVWCARDGSVDHSFALDSIPSCCCFSPDGRLILGGFVEGRLMLWNVHTRELHRTIEDGHAPNYVSTCSFSPDSKLFLSGSHDKVAEPILHLPALYHFHSRMWLLPFLHSTTPSSSPSHAHPYFLPSDNSPLGHSDRSASQNTECDRSNILVLFFTVRGTPVQRIPPRARALES
jgi:hypothetical protein